MREINVLLTAALHCHAVSLVGLKGALRLLPWDGASNLPAFAGNVWAVVGFTGRRDAALDVCRRLREDPRTCDARITAVLESDDPEAQQHALAAGVDDHIVGPLDTKRLSAHFDRICDAFPAFQDGSVIETGELRLDLTAYQATWRKVPFHLALIELRLLYFFLTNPGRLITRTELADALGRDGQSLSASAITGWVGRLSRKLRAAGVPDAVQGMRGHGYRFLPPA